MAAAAAVPVGVAGWWLTDLPYLLAALALAAGATGLIVAVAPRPAVLLATGALLLAFGSTMYFGMIVFGPPALLAGLMMLAAAVLLRRREPRAAGERGAGARPLIVVMAAALVGAATFGGAVAVYRTCGGAIMEGEPPCSDLSSWAMFGSVALAMMGLVVALAPEPTFVFAAGLVIEAYGLVGMLAFLPFALSALMAGLPLMAAGHLWSAKRTRTTQTAP